MNEVVKSLLRQASRSGAIRPVFLQSSYDASRPRWGRSADADSVAIRVPTPWDKERPIASAISFLARCPFDTWKLVQLLRELKPTAVNVHYPGLWALPLFLAVRIATPQCSRVLSFHGSDVTNVLGARPLEKGIWRALISQATAVTTCSGALRARLGSALRSERDILVIHNGADSSVLADELATATGIPESLAKERYVVNVGTYEHKKGQDVLLRAFALLHATDPSLKLVLVGRRGPALENVLALTRELGLEGAVSHFIDAPHALALALLKSAQVFVLSSRQEPFGIVLLEAALLNVPTVATNVDGIPEVVVDEVTGLLVDPDDPQRLAEAVSRVLTDAELRARIVKAAHSRTSESFTGSASYERYLAAMGPNVQIKGATPPNRLEPG